MKDDDVDWAVYHQLDEGMGTTIRELVNQMGFSEEAVMASLSRLVDAMLVEMCGDYVRKLSVQEMLVACQSRYDASCSITFEHGMIRAKSDREQ
jgi:DNA-binding Lrp family transcriptional regulator